MFNVTGGELVIILLVALIVLGPDKLPEAIRKVGQVYGELRRMSNGFQAEIRDALDEPMREMRDTINNVKGGFTMGDGENPPGTTASPGPRLAADDGGASPAESEAAAPSENGTAATPTNGSGVATPADAATTDDPVRPVDPA